MAPSIPPQVNSAAELASSGLSPVVFWLVASFLSASWAYFYLRPRFWPESIINSTFERCKEAKALLKDVPLEHLTDQQRVVWDQTCLLAQKIHDLRRRDHRARQGGVMAFVRAWRGLYKEACSPSAEMDEVKLKLDQLA